MPCARTERTTASPPLISGMRASGFGLSPHAEEPPSQPKLRWAASRSMRATGPPPPQDEGGTCIDKTQISARMLVRQIQRRQRLLPSCGLGGEETREGLVVLVGRRRGQGTRGRLRAGRGEDGRDLPR